MTRDRFDPPVLGLYNICYINGFQAQDSEASFWLENHPDLILRAGDGSPVVDAQWNEMLLDIGTPSKRASIAALIGDWIAGCASSGFAAVDIDNLDSYQRSEGLLHEDDAVAMLSLFAQRAHSLGLAVSQKNALELTHRTAELGSDFAVTEACDCLNECDAYVSSYGNRVLAVEYPGEVCTDGSVYTKARFLDSCARYAAFSRVLRDVQLQADSASDYAFASCQAPRPVPFGGAAWTCLLAGLCLWVGSRRPRTQRPTAN